MDMQASISFEELCERYDACYAFMHEAAEILKNHSGVVGFGIGPKEVNGEMNPDIPCFIVYVEDKRPIKELASSALVPRKLGGVLTDVVAVGSRKHDIHNDFDMRWLALSQENYHGFDALSDRYKRAG